MSSLEATKADGYYFGPEFDPKRHRTLNKYRGVRPPMDKRKGGLQLIRFEMPFKCWCDRCSRVIAKGVRFNATKTCIGMYFSTKILKFSFTCPSCSNPLAISTDPKHAEYRCAEGLKRKTEALECAVKSKSGLRESDIENNEEKKKRKRRSSEGSDEERKSDENNEGNEQRKENNRLREARRSPSISHGSSNDSYISETSVHCSSSSSGSALPGRSSGSSSNGSLTTSNTRSSDGSPRPEIAVPGKVSSCSVQKEESEEDDVIVLPGVEERELLRLDPMRKLAYLSTLSPRQRQQQTLCQAEGPVAAAALAARTAAAAATAARRAALAAQQKQEEEEAAFQAMLDESSLRHGDPYAAHQLLRQQFLNETSNTRSSRSGGHTTAAEAGAADQERNSSRFASLAQAAAASGPCHPAAAPFSADRRAVVAAAAASSLESSVAAAVAAAADKLDVLCAAEDQAAADALIAQRVIFRREKTGLQQYMEKTERLKTSSIFKPRAATTVHAAKKHKQQHPIRPPHAMR